MIIMPVMASIIMAVLISAVAIIVATTFNNPKDIGNADIIKADETFSASSETLLPSVPENLEQPKLTTTQPAPGKFFQYDVIGTTCWVIPGTQSANASGLADGTSHAIESVDTSSENPASWRFLIDGAWIEAGDTLVDLADLTDEIVFDVSYSYASRLRIHGRDVPGITGEAMPGYHATEPSERFGGEQRFICPIYWTTACMLQTASDAALSDGYRLVVYDAYRPYSASAYMTDMVADFVSSTATTFGPNWSTSWFVASGVSSHNTGCAVDVFMLDADSEYEVVLGDGEAINYEPLSDIGDGTVTQTDYPTPIDECSEWSTYADYPGGPISDKIAGSVFATKLHDIMTKAGFTQLSSEWWHYDDTAGDEYVMDATGGSGLDFPYQS